MAKIQNPTKVITGVNTRWSYANVWDAKSINGGAPKYSVSLIIPKSDTVTVICVIKTHKQIISVINETIFFTHSLGCINSL